jgi:acyl carrier protein
MIADQLQPSTARAGRAATMNEPGDGIRHLPAEAQAAFARFQAAGDPAMLDPVLLGILEHFASGPVALPLSDLPGGTRLIEDLAFDSLTMVEVVFFTEELFGINVTNAEVLQVHTLDDLRSFIRHKVAGRTPGAPPLQPARHV